MLVFAVAESFAVAENQVLHLVVIKLIEIIVEQEAVKSLILHPRVVNLLALLQYRQGILFTLVKSQVLHQSIIKPLEIIVVYDMQ